MIYFTNSLRIDIWGCLDKNCSYWKKGDLFVCLLAFMQCSSCCYSSHLLFTKMWWILFSLMELPSNFFILKISSMSLGFHPLLIGTWLIVCGWETLFHWDSCPMANIDKTTVVRYVQISVGQLLSFDPVINQIINPDNIKNWPTGLFLIFVITDL
jgi:hypothetical protein